MLEEVVESKLVRFIKKVLRGIAYKFVSPGCRGVPDRLILLPIPEKHRAIVAKYIYFIECKRPGETPPEHQKRQHRKIRKLGFVVRVLSKPIPTHATSIEEYFDV
jgi:hypothetical protein